MSKRKKILFILNSMIAGGPQRSFLNFVNEVDKSKFQIDLLLFTKEGDLFEEVPDFVNVRFIQPEGLFCSYNENSFSFLKWLPIRIVIVLFGRIIKYFSNSSLIKWKLRFIFLKKSEENYDIGIGYSEGPPIYYLVEYVNAKKKIGRIPTDYEKAKINYLYDKKFYNNLDYIFAVSEINKRTLEKFFPRLENRILLFESVILPKTIRVKTNYGDGFKDNWEGLRILTLARLDITKGIELAIKASAILKSKGYKFRWYFVGKGDIKYYSDLIYKMELAEYFSLMNPVSNPYKLVKQADIYVQPSFYEGKSNAVNEAKALYKPIVITNFTTAKDHIHHMKEGLVCEIDEISIANTVEKLLINTDLRKKLSEYLSTNFVGNRDSIEILENIAFKS